jgi:putative polyketide hydroxylase
MVVGGWFVLRPRPACPRGGGQQATCPQMPGTNLKVLGFNIGAQVARGRSTVPAGWVFSLQAATRLVSSTRRPAVGLEAKHRGVQDAHNLAWKLWQRCSMAARLVSRARYSIYLSRNERHPIGLLSLYAAAALCPVRLLHGSRRRGALLIYYGAVTMGCYRGTARQPYSTRRRTHLAVAPPKGAIAGEPGIRAPHIAVTFGGREIFPPSRPVRTALRAARLPGPMARRGSRLRSA